MLKAPPPRTSADVPVIVIGAGPYGLSVTRHLRKAGVTTHTFGTPMSFWRDHMPVGMLLRSAWTACNIGSSKGPLTLEAFEAASERNIPDPVPLDDFIDYGLWYQEQVVPDLDHRMVTNVSRQGSQFVATLDDGDQVVASRVVVAAGISLFARRPVLFDHLSPEQSSPPSTTTTSPVLRCTGRGGWLRSECPGERGAACRGGSQGRADRALEQHQLVADRKAGRSSVAVVDPLHRHRRRPPWSQSPDAGSRRVPPASPAGADEAGLSGDPAGRSWMADRQARRCSSDSRQINPFGRVAVGWGSPPRPQRRHQPRR